ncbi:MAG: hypothetical protein AAFV95_03870 [Bacteroidota bacterium]
MLLQTSSRNGLPFWMSVSLFIGFLCPVMSWAQPFQKAPKLPKDVRRITEWVRPDFKHKSIKSSISEYDRSGNLVKYYQHDSPDYRQLYAYDAKGRMTESRQGTDSAEVVTFYAYKKDLEIKEERFRGKVLKSMSYYKKGQLVELKNFVKGGELGDKYLLKDRTVYSYNKRDSLQGETYYFYPIPGKGEAQKRKLIYLYDPATGLRLQEKYYDFDKKLRMIRAYHYDGQNRILRVDLQFLRDNTVGSTEYKYKNGKIWQRIENLPHKRSVMVYVDGRLIRNRIYMGGNIFTIVDYQYDYFP